MTVNNKSLLITRYRSRFDHNDVFMSAKFVVDNNDLDSLGITSDKVYHCDDNEVVWTVCHENQFANGDGYGNAQDYEFCYELYSGAYVKLVDNGYIWNEVQFDEFVGFGYTSQDFEVPLDLDGDEDQRLQIIRDYLTQ